ncbi:MAG: hypothetical protein QXE67_01605 [Nitrososphaerota archaeon]|nr:hypothetical protein [Candidatus Geocrenenecus dongiae]
MYLEEDSAGEDPTTQHQPNHTKTSHSKKLFSLKEEKLKHILKDLSYSITIIY